MSQSPLTSSSWSSGYQSFGQSVPPSPISVGQLTPSVSPSTSGTDLDRAVQSYNRKKKYNQEYYQSVTKPKKEQVKTQLSQIPDLQELYTLIAMLQNENLILRQQVGALQDGVSALTRRNTELMQINAVNILPKLDRLSLN